MAINNLEAKCQEYGQVDEGGQKKSTLTVHTNMQGYAVKPKTFNITENRVNFAKRQL